MRLWHEALLPVISDKRLVRQHCECCALRGNFWGHKHSTVDYVFKYSYDRLYKYHVAVIAEMIQRDMKPDTIWLTYGYRGKDCHESIPQVKDDFKSMFKPYIYPEHDDAYLQFCIEKLIEKGEPRKNFESLLKETIYFH